jgi:hypothetical protein
LKAVQQQALTTSMQELIDRVNKCFSFWGIEVEERGKVVHT